MSQRLVPLAASLVAVLLVTAPAHAERWRGVDATGDVSGQRIDPGDSLCRSSVTDVTAPAEPNEDIRAVKVRYSSEGLTLVVRFRDLDPELGTNVYATVRTASTTWSLAVNRRESEPGSFSTYATWSRAPARRGLCGQVTRFVRVPARVNTRTDRVVAKVRSERVQSASWVRVGVSAQRSFRIPGVEPTPDGLYSYTTYADDWGDRGDLSPRIRMRPGVVS